MLATGALLSFGLVMVYSTTMVQWGTYYFTRQLIWALFGVGVCVIAATIDYRILKRLAWPMFLLVIVCLALVLVSPLGIERNHARRWLGYNRTSLFQPSELAKPALIILLAWYADRFPRHLSSFKGGLVVPGLLIGLVAGLVFVEPDFGTAILIGAIGGVMLIIGGVRLRHVVPVALCALIGLGAFMLYNPKCANRIFHGWLDQEKNKEGIAYQAYQAKLAIGSGGWKGLGIGNGVHKLGFVPEAHTDFIFSVIGEETGLIGTIGVMVAFILLVVGGILTARHARDTFGMLLAFGITFWIGLQAAINIGVVTSALPNKGLPLPFISYGGSSLVVTLGSIGVLVNIGLRSLAHQVTPIDEVEPEEIAEPELARC